MSGLRAAYCAAATAVAAFVLGLAWHIYREITWKPTVPRGREYRPMPADFGR